MPTAESEAPRCAEVGACSDAGSGRGPSVVADARQVEATSSSALLAEELAPDEQMAFQMGLWELLSRRTSLYTMGESSSVPESIAQRLLASVCFTLGIDREEPDPAAIRRLLAQGIDTAFGEGMALVERKAKRIGGLWEQVALTTPLLESVALKGTLESLREFPARYDYRSFAHEIPSDIDYPLAHPVSESVLGVDYVTEYLERLLIENDFMQRFDLGLCKALLRAVHPAYRELLINLYEPIAVNAVGLALAGVGDVRRLRAADEDRARIAEVVKGKPAAEVSRLLGEAAADVCESLGIEDERSRSYLARTAAGVRPRLMRFSKQGDVLAGGGLAGVFLEF